MKKIDEAIELLNDLSKKPINESDMIPKEFWAEFVEDSKKQRAKKLKKF